MNTPRSAPKEAKSPTLKRVGLVAGAAIIALVAGVAVKCAKIIEDLSGGISDTFDATNNDDEMGADGGEFLAESNDGGSGKPPTKVIVIKTDEEQLSAIIGGSSLDKRIWDKMDSLMGALRRHYILPEFEDEDGRTSCDNADRVGPGLSMRRKTSGGGNQLLIISNGIPGCSARDMASILWQTNGPNNELLLRIDMSTLDPEMGSIGIPASDGDIGIIRRFVDHIEEYAKERVIFKSALRDYWGKGDDRFDLERFQQRTGVLNPNEAMCRLGAKYRALIARERYKLQPPVFTEENSAEYIQAQQERVQLQQQDQGDLQCNRSQDE